METGVLLDPIKPPLTVQKLNQLVERQASKCAKSNDQAQVAAPVSNRKDIASVALLIADRLQAGPTAPELAPNPALDLSRVGAFQTAPPGCSGDDLPDIRHKAQENQVGYRNESRRSFSLAERMQGNG